MKKTRILAVKFCLLLTLTMSCKTMHISAADSIKECNRICAENPHVKSASEGFVFIVYSSYTCECRK